MSSILKSLLPILTQIRVELLNREDNLKSMFLFCMNHKRNFNSLSLECYAQGSWDGKMKTWNNEQSQRIEDTQDIELQSAVETTETTMAATMEPHQRVTLLWPNLGFVSLGQQKVQMSVCANVSVKSQMPLPMINWVGVERAKGVKGDMLHKSHWLSLRGNITKMSSPTE